MLCFIFRTPHLSYILNKFCHSIIISKHTKRLYVFLCHMHCSWSNHHSHLFLDLHTIRSCFLSPLLFPAVHSSHLIELLFSLNHIHSEQCTIFLKYICGSSITLFSGTYFHISSTVIIYEILLSWSLMTM